jgi:hypothetical protein
LPRFSEGSVVEIAALTAFLAPFVGPLMEGIAGGAGQKAGGAGWKHAVRIWEALWQKVKDAPAAEEAAKELAGRPDDTRAQAAFELQLEKLLAEDPQLAAAIEGLWHEAKQAGVVATGDRAIAVGGDARGTFVTGDSNVIRE